jgi:hypothetical protein
MTTTPRDSPSDVTSTSPPDGTGLFQSHEHLLNEEDVMDTLSYITNFVVPSKLRPGMVIPCIASGLSGWTDSVWKGSYQISTTEPLFMKKVYYTVAYVGDLPENIRVDLNGLDATACVKTNCPNKHPLFVSGSVDKDAVKAELEGIQAPEFKRKLFAAVDAF